MSQGRELQSPPPAPAAVSPAAPAVAAREEPRGSLRGLWAGVALAAVLLAASGAARAWQARRFDQVLRDGQVPPFQLSRLPMQIGAWSGVDDKLDPEIAKITGGTDIVTRLYRHKITGQTIGLIFLFGPSTNVYGHSPEVCYPANGSSLVSGPIPKTVTSAKTGGSWPFLSSIYVKGEGAPVRNEVYWTWRYSGRWNPWLESHRGFERIPGMFKVHVDRVVRSKEELDMLDVGNPCQAFLALLMPEIDRLLAEADAAKAKAAKAPKR